MKYVDRHIDPNTGRFDRDLTEILSWGDAWLACSFLCLSLAAIGAWPIGLFSLPCSLAAAACARRAENSQIEMAKSPPLPARSSSSERG